MHRFWKLIPGGNPTILTEASGFPEATRADAARQMMSALHLGAEQVGFIDLASRRLDMMGGEFCLNATRAFALCLALEGCLTQMPPSPSTPCKRWEGTVFVSGTTEAVEVVAQEWFHSSGPLYTAGACLHFSQLPIPQQVDPHIYLVRLPGISHLVIQASAPPPLQDLEETCAQLRHRFALEQEEAVGCLWLVSNEENFLYPAVWVRDTDTLCLESACGSGTLACALILAHSAPKSRELTLHHSIRQMSGDMLEVRLLPAPSGGWNIWVDGPVCLAAAGQAYLPHEALHRSNNDKEQP